MWLETITAHVAPFFIVMSPIISYTDQAVSMHRNKSSAGFSLDIPLIMLVASILKIFYWPGEHYEMSLLLQAAIMVVMQLILLRIALDHRPPPSSKGGDAATPFAGASQEETPRPFHFWQWRSPRPYWQAIMYFVAGLFAAQLVLSPFEPIYTTWTDVIGVIGLSVEAFLPIPQILTNMRSRSCKGFRLSLLASWLIGDALKIFWFFTAAGEIPWVFKGCGIFQASCDSALGIQYAIYGDNTLSEVKEHPMAEMQAPGSSGYSPRGPLDQNGRPRARTR